MDPVSLVVGALAVGLSETVTSAVQDAYAGLRDALVRKLSRDRGEDGAAEQAVQALEVQAADPESLRTSVSAAGLATDEQILAAAQRVLQAADPAGARVGKYVVDLREAKAVQVGDNPTMTVNF
ncbi:MULTISPECIES: hypothetical protein [Streptomyces]|uniref:hypothetical protein n=1 Tax=Streptomyces TaxID=1883 RepID=UPI00287F5229|nr:hypothetical protein [Streptomyces sp. CGMCC 4.1456]WNF67251.1 hypothetical protein RJD14_33890 [Streptomyces sp. CGMCC 4.1456]